MVSQKAYDAKCAELEACQDERVSDLKAFDMKDHLCRTKCSELIKELKDCNNAKSDTIVPHDPANE
jgi:hypothetical protein